ncbi:hypothetical protein D3C71_2244900 [compost metagenome]
MASSGTVSLPRNSAILGASLAKAAFTRVTTGFGLNSVATGSAHLGSVMQV